MRFIFVLLLVVFLQANNLVITSDNFYHKEGEKKAIFSGHAIANDGNNLIKAGIITIFLDKNNQVIKYVAQKNVYFELKGPKKFIKGTCNQLTYLPDEDKYILFGNVFLEDVLHKRKVFGDEVIYDNKNHTSIAKSLSNKPVKFIFKVKKSK